MVEETSCNEVKKVLVSLPDVHFLALFPGKDVQNKKIVKQDMAAIPWAQIPPDILEKIKERLKVSQLKYLAEIKNASEYKRQGIEGRKFKNDILNFLLNKELITACREKISEAMRNRIWEEYLDGKAYVAKCWCCRRKDISRKEYHAGHIVAVVHGGTNVIQNLRPICADCNLDMKETNMFQYMRDKGYELPPEVDKLLEEIHVKIAVPPPSPGSAGHTPNPEALIEQMNNLKVIEEPPSLPIAPIALTQTTVPSELEKKVQQLEVQLASAYQLIAALEERFSRLQYHGLNYFMHFIWRKFDHDTFAFDLHLPINFINSRGIRQGFVEVSPDGQNWTRLTIMMGVPLIFPEVTARFVRFITTPVDRFEQSYESILISGHFYLGYRHLHNKS